MEAETPKHIGLILDGNRRFSRKILNHAFKGHDKGAEKVEKLIDWAKELNVKELTLYVFSMQNFRRPREEVDYLFELFAQKFEELSEKEETLREKGIRINYVGRLYLFPKNVQESAKKLMEKTAGNKELVVNFAMGYGGREEIIDAAKKIAEKVKKGELSVEDIDEDVFEDCLYNSSQPDIIIRTSGEHRISNFLSYQSAYSEFFFIDKLWPEFEKEDFVRVIDTFRNRERRFGK